MNSWNCAAIYCFPLISVCERITTWKSAVSCRRLSNEYHNWIHSSLIYSNVSTFRTQRMNGYWVISIFRLNKANVNISFHIHLLFHSEQFLIHFFLQCWVCKNNLFNIYIGTNKSPCTVLTNVIHVHFISCQVCHLSSYCYPLRVKSCYS